MTVTVIDSCASSIISTNFFTALITYDVWSGVASPVINLDWNVSPSYCPLITYNLYEQGTINPASAIFFVNGASFEVFTNDVNDVMTYLLELSGEVTGYPATS